MRVGIIGLDSTHAVEFTRRLNDNPASSVRVVAACAGAPTDFPLSVRRRETITAELITTLGIKLVAGIPQLLEAVDAVMVLSCDGRRHAEETLPLLAARKPIFVDKPLTADWCEAVALLESARLAGTPCFSASALRYSAGIERARALRDGRPVQIEVHAPRLAEPGHPDLLWYGIHAVEAAYAVLGPGCESVQRRCTADFDVSLGRWPDGSEVKIIRTSESTGREFQTRIHAPRGETTITGHSYDGLLRTIGDFFTSGRARVSVAEMTEVLAFIAAADASAATGGSVALQRFLAPVNQSS